MEKLEKTDVIEIPSEENLPKDAFTKLELLDFWEKSLIPNVKLNKNIATYNVFSSLKIDLPKENHIKIQFSSKSSLAEFDKEKDWLVHTIREKFNNHIFVIENEILETTEENHILSNEDKYKLMLAKNPLIEKLRVELGLDYYE